MKIDIGKVINTTKVVADALDKAANRNSNPLRPADVPTITRDIVPELEQQVNLEIGSVIQNLDNREPWYQSRVILGTGVALLSMGASFLGYQVGQVDQMQITEVILQGIGIAGTLFALYGRIVANKPLGK